MSKIVSTTVQTISFDEPKDPMDISIISMLPFGVMVKEVTFKYVTPPRDEYLNSLRRHDAAVKANHTRKKKGGATC